MVKRSARGWGEMTGEDSSDEGGGPTRGEIEAKGREWFRNVHGRSLEPLVVVIRAVFVVVSASEQVGVPDTIRRGAHRGFNFGVGGQPRVALRKFGRDRVALAGTRSGRRATRRAQHAAPVDGAQRSSRVRKPGVHLEAPLPRSIISGRSEKRGASGRGFSAVAERLRGGAHGRFVAGTSGMRVGAAVKRARRFRYRPSSPPRSSPNVRKRRGGIKFEIRRISDGARCGPVRFRSIPFDVSVVSALTPSPRSGPTFRPPILSTPSPRCWRRTRRGRSPLGPRQTPHRCAEVVQQRLVPDPPGFVLCPDEHRPSWPTAPTVFIGRPMLTLQGGASRSGVVVTAGGHAPLSTELGRRRTARSSPGYRTRCSPAFGRERRGPPAGDEAPGRGAGARRGFARDPGCYARRRSSSRPKTRRRGG